MARVSDKELVWAAVQAASDAIFCEDLDGIIRTWNSGAEQLYGFQAAEVVGQPAHSLGAFPKDDLRARVEAGETVSPEHAFLRRKDGDEIQVWLQVCPVRDSSGRLIAFSHISRQVPDDDDEPTFRRFFEAAPNAVLIVDPRGRLERVNSAAEALFGYTRDEMCGMLVETLVPERFREEHPHYRDSFFQAPRARPMGAGRDLTALHRDGYEIPVEIGLKPLRIQQRKLVMVSIVDIRKRKTAERRFELAVEAAPCAMLMIDSAGLITLVNSQTELLFGYDREHLLGSPLEELVPHRYRRAHVDLRKSYLRKPTTRRMGAGRDLFALRSDGREVPVEIGLNPLTTPDGDFVLASIIDVTERRKATEELRASLRDKELLLQEIHHRVKNNLAVIGSILYLQSSVTENPQMTRVLQECQERVRSMALAHERLYLTGDLAHLDFADYIRELAEQLARNNAIGGLMVSLEFDLESLPLDLKRAVPCGLILNELITNAFKHAFPGRKEGEVKISFHEEGGFVTLQVKDNGQGYQPKTDHRNSGSLGLRLASSLARQLDAVFDIERCEEGGTRARLVFPQTETDQ